MDRSAQPAISPAAEFKYAHKSGPIPLKRTAPALGPTRLPLKQPARSLFLLGLALASLLPSLKAEPETRLWYKAPAATWNEALPVGNGRLGAMVFGGKASERIQFNEDSLWTGKPHNYVRPGALEVLPELRALISEGRNAEADILGKAKFIGSPPRQKAYQPFGDIGMVFPGHENAEHYRRELDLVSGIARTSYSVDGITFTREVFASYPAQAIVLRVSASKPRALTLKLALSSPHLGALSETQSEHFITLKGQLKDDGLKFQASLLVKAQGGSSKIVNGGIDIQAADELVLILSAATSYIDFNTISGNPAESCAGVLERLQDKGWEQLLREHLNAHKGPFERSLLDLGTSPSAQATDERVKNLRKNPNAEDRGLESLYYNYGRYLLLSSSRPGSQPANLQGVWNELMDPPWESKYTTNINVEMNYWPAEVCNLAECHTPLFALVADVAISGERTAREQYGAKGWVLHHNTDLWRGTAPVNNIDGIWPTGGAWLCHHLWEHYLFSGDLAFLKKNYPVLKGSCQFFLDTLVRDKRTGWLMTSPSFSPEMNHPKGSLVAGPTMDNQLVRSLFALTIEAAQALGEDQTFQAQLAAAKAQLPPNQIGRHGQLQEWLDDVDKPNNGHRHMSPLWGLYPGADITAAEPKVYEAAKVLLNWRGEGSTGWSYAWRIPLWARVGNGDYAHRQLTQLLARKTLPNLFDLCGPFQIDGNFGATAGIAELLLQSHERTSDGTRIIRLLPALPHNWPEGEITGLRARDGFEIDLIWSKGQLREARVRSKLGRTCELRLGDKRCLLHTQAGEEYTPLEYK